MLHLQLSCKTKINSVFCTHDLSPFVYICNKRKLDREAGKNFDWKKLDGNWQSFLKDFLNAVVRKILCLFSLGNCRHQAVRGENIISTRSSHISNKWPHSFIEGWVQYAPALDEGGQCTFVLLLFYVVSQSITLQKRSFPLGHHQWRRK